MTRSTVRHDGPLETKLSGAASSTAGVFRSKDGNVTGSYSVQQQVMESYTTPASPQPQAPLGASLGVPAEAVMIEVPVVKSVPIEKTATPEDVTPASGLGGKGNGKPSKKKASKRKKASKGRKKSAKKGTKRSKKK
ncbi:hypothetical protein STCU_10069 [Strigomonas culicis]|uniref:Uncharacterized protein n=1 Tax=Strigomonas culicis TaxID=28005 RepID=S9TJK9_9TRYP|nr:hypothetical protein STCU_10069 [Strigomonas culicis]|eukprot:EPY18297.1 hypothetical protein STCU_10069 [Strigomonas culicis]